jgi:crossover junction endodeoxyribonuclease RuvC
MSEVVIGIDASLDSTGVAVLHSTQPELNYLRTVVMKGKRDATIVQRLIRLRETTRLILSTFPGNLLVSEVLVVIEGPAGAAPGGSTWDRAGLWWLILAGLPPGARVGVVSPSTRAKWATGNGRADKAAVAVSMARRAPDMEIANSDEADALALAWMGAQWLGWKPIKTKYEEEALKAAKWPVIVA